MRLVDARKSVSERIAHHWRHQSNDMTGYVSITSSIFCHFQKPSIAFCLKKFLHCLQS